MTLSAATLAELWGTGRMEAAAEEEMGRAETVEARAEAAMGAEAAEGVVGRAVEMETIGVLEV